MVLESTGLNDVWHTEQVFELLPQRCRHTGHRFPFLIVDCAFTIRFDDYASRRTPTPTRM